MTILKGSFNAPKRLELRKVLDIVGWLLVLLLLFVGLSSLFGRVESLNNEFSKEVASTGAGLNDFDIRYIQHYFVAGVHLVFGFVVFAFAPFQFMTSIRKRFIGFHRWIGRVWMIRAFALMLGAATPRVLDRVDSNPRQWSSTLERS